MARSWQNMNNIMVELWQDFVEILARPQQDLKKIMTRSWQNKNNILVETWQDLVEILARSQQDLERPWQNFGKI